MLCPGKMLIVVNYNISIASNLNESGEGKLEDIDLQLLRDFAFGARAVTTGAAAKLGLFCGRRGCEPML